MNLEEMLEYTAEQYLDDRTDLLDGDPDVLWSDAYLVRMFNRGAKILARRAWVIQEYAVAPAGVITLATGKVLYPLHKSILRVFDATPSNQTSPLGRGDDIKLRNPYPPSSDAFDIGQAAAIAGTTINSPGAPLAIATDAAFRTMRVSPPPAAAQSGLLVYLKIARLPIVELTLDNTDGICEIPEDYHEDLCEYAAGKALTLPNVDSQNKGDGYKLLDAFDAVVKEARRDRQRAELNGSRWDFCSTTAVLR